MKRWIGLTVCLFLATLAIVPQVSAANAPAITVGRVYHIEGDLLRYVPEERNWVSMVKDAPFGTEDTLFSGNRGMAEMIVPNGTWIRVGDNTQIQFIALDSDFSETDVASGTARFYNRSSRSIIKATSPFGYVLANPGTVFDFYVGENAVEVVAVKGQVSFVHAATNARYNVSAGYQSILADWDQVSSGDGTIDPDWSRWNRTRENFWNAKARVRGRSFNYLPPSLQNESYALEENGRWENVRYEGSSRWFWRPTNVSTGWSPFTTGRWTDWYGDQAWIPAEPFGYVTHHYGNWINIGNQWYWAPPVTAARVGLPLLNIGFFWSPGRVSWIHSGTHVGWVPLAPRETYYSHRNWGDPHETVVTNVNITQITINIGSYAYARHAVVVPRDNFYGVNNYRTVREPGINPTTIINNYRAAPVVNNTVINNYTTIKERHNFTNTAVKEMPHNTVINRIEKNAPAIQKGKKETAVTVQEQVKSIKEGKVNREARIEAPKITNYIVPAKEINQPKSDLKLQQKEIKNTGKRAPSDQTDRAVVPKPMEPIKQGPVAPKQVEPIKQGPAVTPKQVEPIKQGPVTPKQVEPIKQGPAVTPKQVEPIKQGPISPRRQGPVEPKQIEPIKQGPAVTPKQVEPIKQGPAEPKQIEPIKRGPVTPTQVEPIKQDRPVTPKQVEPIKQGPKPVEPIKQGPIVPKQVEPLKQGPVTPKRIEPIKQGPPDQPAESKKVEPVKRAKPIVKPDQVDTAPVKSDKVAPTKEELEKIKEKARKKLEEETGQLDTPR